MEIISKKIEAALVSLTEALEESPVSFNIRLFRNFGEKHYRGEIEIRDIENFIGNLKRTL